MSSRRVSFHTARDGGDVPLPGSDVQAAPPTPTVPSPLADADREGSSTSPTPTDNGNGTPRSGGQAADDKLFERRLASLQEDQASMRANITNQWSSSWSSHAATVIVPAALSMVKAMARESAIARCDAEDATNSLAERDAELSGLLSHQQRTQHDLEATRAELREVTSRASSLAEVGGDVHRQRDTAEAQLRSTEKTLADAREMIRSLEVRCQHHREESAKATGLIDGVRSEARELQGQVMERDNELLSANSMLTEVRSRLRHAEATSKTLRERNDALIREFQRVADDVANGRKPNQSPSRTPPTGSFAAKSPRDVLSPLPEGADGTGSPSGEHALDSANTLNAISIVSDRLDAAIRAKQAEVDDVQARLDAQTAKRKELEQEIRSLNAAREEDRQFVGSATEKHSALESKLKRKEDELAFSESEHKKARDECVELTHTRRTLERAVEDLTAANSNLKREAALWERRVQDNEQHGYQTSGTIEKLKQDVSDKAATVAHLEVEVDTLKREAEETDAKLKLYAEALQESSEVIEPLREELRRYDRIVAALKEKFVLRSDRHNVSGGTPRTAHFRRDRTHDGSVSDVQSTTYDGDGGDSAVAEVEEFVQKTSGSIVERLQDQIFAREDELKALRNHTKTLVLKLEDAEVSIDRLSRDALTKQEEFRQSLQDALQTFARVGGYDKLVEQVYDAKEVHFKVVALQTELDQEKRRSQQLQVRCRVLETHVEQLSHECGSRATSDRAHFLGTARATLSQSPPRSAFAARLDAAADGGSSSRAASSPPGRGRASMVLSVDGDGDDDVEHSNGVSNDEPAALEAQADADRRIVADTRVNPVATTPRGLLFRPAGQEATSKSQREAAAVEHARSGRFVELEAKMAKVERMRQQLLDLETMAMATSSPAKRHVMFGAMRGIHRDASAMHHGTNDDHDDEAAAAAHTGGYTPRSAFASGSTTPRQPHAGPPVATRLNLESVGGDAHVSSLPSSSHNTPRRVGFLGPTVGRSSSGGGQNSNMLSQSRASLRDAKPRGHVITRWR